MNTLINELTRKNLLWQGSNQPLQDNLVTTGFDELDLALKGGLPRTGTIEVQSQVGIGELRLFFPHLLHRYKQSERLLVFISPPMQINSEALAHLGFSLEQVLILTPQTQKEALWCAEQCLKSGACHTVLLWQQKLAIHQVKRLQLACEKGDALHIVMRQPSEFNHTLPVALSLTLKPSEKGVYIKINKCKGNWPHRRSFSVDMSQYWPEFSPLLNKKNIPTQRIMVS